MRCSNSDLLTLLPEGKAEVGGGHIFISYSWANAEMVHKVKDELKVDDIVHFTSKCIFVRRTVILGVHMYALKGSHVSKISFYFEKYKYNVPVVFSTYLTKIKYIPN